MDKRPQQQQQQQQEQQQQCFFKEEEYEAPQKCPICLEDLFNVGRKKVVGTCVPCGHCLHTECFQQWKGSAYNTNRAAAAPLPNGRRLRTVVKCPMCNVPADTFVSLYLDGTSTSSTGRRPLAPASATNDKDIDNGEDNEDEAEEFVDDRVVETQTQEEEQQQLVATTTATNNNNYDVITSTSGGDDNDDNDNDVRHVVLVERMKSKLKRYKRQNKSLKRDLEVERQETEEIILSTIQNFYKIIEKQEEERRRWNRGALNLRKELDLTNKARAQDQLNWQIQQRFLEQELETLRKDCQKANEQVLVATKGFEQLKLYNSKRQTKLHNILQQKAKLVYENRQLKQALLLSTLTSSSSSSREEGAGGGSLVGRPF